MILELSTPSIISQLPPANELLGPPPPPPGGCARAGEGRLAGLVGAEGACKEEAAEEGTGGA